MPSRWPTPRELATRRSRFGDVVSDQVLAKFRRYLEIGVRLRRRPEEAAAKVLAAYDAGCRRFDSAIGGLGGCPFAAGRCRSVIFRLKK